MNSDLCFYRHKNGIEFSKVDCGDCFALLFPFRNEAWPGLHRLVINNSDEQEKWFKEESKKNNIFHLKANHFIGSVDGDVGIFSFEIDNYNQIVKEFYGVFEWQRKKGYGFKILEAGIDLIFELFPVNRVECEILENNEASLIITNRVGFKEEGRKRKCIFRNGKYLDSIVFGLLREEWEKLERVIAYDGCCNKSYNLIKERKEDGK